VLTGRHASSLRRKFFQFSGQKNFLNFFVNIIFIFYSISKYFNSTHIRVIFLPSVVWLCSAFCCRRLTIFSTFSSRISLLNSNQKTGHENTSDFSVKFCERKGTYSASFWHFFCISYFILSSF
jgi:hypothetical protein